jgi:hypothetical protein
VAIYVILMISRDGDVVTSVLIRGVTFSAA